MRLYLAFAVNVDDTKRSVHRQEGIDVQIATTLHPPGSIGAKSSAIQRDVIAPWKRAIAIALLVSMLKSSSRRREIENIHDCRKTSGAGLQQTMRKTGRVARSFRAAVSAANSPTPINQPVIVDTAFQFERKLTAQLLQSGVCRHK